MTVNFHQREALLSCLGQRRQKDVRAPGHLHRGTHLAGVIGDGHDPLYHETMACFPSAATTQGDRHGLLPIAWKEMRLQLYMLCSGKPQYDFHRSRFPQLAFEPVLD